MSQWEQWRYVPRVGANPVPIGARPISALDVEGGSTIREVDGHIFEPESTRGIQIRWRADLTRQARFIDPLGRAWEILGFNERGRRDRIDLRLARYLLTQLTGGTQVGAATLVAPPGWALQDKDGNPLLTLEVAAFTSRFTRHVTHGFLFNGAMLFQLPVGAKIGDTPFVGGMSGVTIGGWGGAWAASVISRGTAVPVGAGGGRPIFPYLAPVLFNSGWQNFGASVRTAIAKVLNDVSEREWPGVVTDRTELRAGTPTPAYVGLTFFNINERERAFDWGSAASDLSRGFENEIQREFIRTLEPGDVVAIHQGPYE